MCHDYGRKPEKMPKRLEGDFDYIVVDAGTAGCIVANRLSADPGTRVLLLEAGGNDNWIWYHIPVGYLFAIGNPRADWCFRTEPVPGLKRHEDHFLGANAHHGAGGEWRVEHPRVRWDITDAFRDAATQCGIKE